MLSDNNLKAVCSVTQMAKKLGLSRARFYQLQKMGVFPRPVYCPRTRCPFYPLDLQQRCLAIRRTGIGYNGWPIVFYSMRKDKPVKPQNQLNPTYKQLADTLRQMGLNVTLNTVNNSVKVLYPKGLPSHTDEGTVIRDLFRYLRQEA